MQRTPDLAEFNIFYIDPETLRQELRYGYKMMAVLKSTPAWAQTNPAFGVRSVPAGLDLPVTDPRNTWAAFVGDIAKRYAGQIDTWAIWNEVEIPHRPQRRLQHLGRNPGAVLPALESGLARAPPIPTPG